jgi:hypothetical protein
LLPAGESISSVEINCDSNLLFANRLGPPFIDVLEGRAVPATVFRIAQDGSLTRAGDAPPIPGFGHNVVSVLLSPDDRYLYLSDSSVSRSIAAYSVGADGSLSQVAGSPFPVNGLELSPEAVPMGIVTNAAGTALFTAIYRDMVGSFNVSSSGQLSAALGSPYRLINRASEVVTIAAYPAKACQTGGSDFDICIQSGDQVLRVNSETGEYQLADCDRVILEGTGSLKPKGCTLTLHHNSFDRRIQAMLNTCQKKGSATVQVLSPRRTFSFSDTNIADGCGCS